MLLVVEGLLVEEALQSLALAVDAPESRVDRCVVRELDLAELVDARLKGFL